MLQKRASVAKGAELCVTQADPDRRRVRWWFFRCSDRALVLDALWGLAGASIELARSGLQLGADVPLFVRGMPGPKASAKG